MAIGLFCGGTSIAIFFVNSFARRETCGKDSGRPEKIEPAI